MNDGQGQKSMNFQIDMSKQSKDELLSTEVVVHHSARSCFAASTMHQILIKGICFPLVSRMFRWHNVSAEPVHTAEGTVARTHDTNDAPDRASLGSSCQSLGPFPRICHQLLQ